MSLLRRLKDGRKIRLDEDATPVFKNPFYVHPDFSRSGDHKTPGDTYLYVGSISIEDIERIKKREKKENENYNQGKN